MESRVEYNFLGKSGLKVSNICLGTVTFGHHEDFNFCGLPTSEDVSFRIMDKYKDNGGNFLDTANIYAYGRSEEIVGNWLQRNGRDKMVVATKVRYPFDSDVNSVGLSRRHIVDSCEQSLRRLQTHYIDLYQSHCWDSATPIEETLRTFDDLIRCGKVRYFGCSDVCGWQLQKIVDKLEHMGLNRCISLQQQYNILTRQAELDEFMVCKNEGVGVLPWGALKGGLLTGKFKRGDKVSGTDSRIAYMQTTRKFNDAAPDWKKFAEDEAYWKVIDMMSSIAEQYGKSVPQVAIRWLLQKEGVPSVLIGTTSVAQLDDNMGAAKGWQLSDDDMSRLDTAGTPMLLAPYSVIWNGNQDRYNPFNRSIRLPQTLYGAFPLRD